MLGEVERDFNTVIINDVVTENQHDWMRRKTNM